MEESNGLIVPDQIEEIAMVKRYFHIVSLHIQSQQTGKPG
jgi:hypothetical protein